MQADPHDHIRSHCSSVKDKVLNSLPIVSSFASTIKIDRITDPDLYGRWPPAMGHHLSAGQPPPPALVVAEIEQSTVCGEVGDPAKPNSGPLWFALEGHLRGRHMRLCTMLGVHTVSRYPRQAVPRMSRPRLPNTDAIPTCT